MDQLQRICEATGKSQSEIVKDAIAAYLGQVQVNPANPDQKRLLDIESKIDQLLRLTGLTPTEKQIPPQPPPQRFTGLIQGEEQKPNPSISPIQQGLTGFAQDDMEDEPDEILTDFLEPEQASPEAKLPTGEEYTLRDICDRYGMSYKNVTRNAVLKGQSKLEYLRDQTGVSWVQRGKRYVQLE